ncbi:MAG: glucose-1-phosphate adenylyltransferase [Chloroflexi bacterium]|nr:glucose-1-phosphate adenylyltransferase [Chloroflexota bacterium]MBI4267810.1 glucose-1-phosphate adenylyltransferase [Chloroflexota bacterium]
MERVLTIIMAGGVGERLKPLTNERAKPAVPFGGVFRIIDFTLSNCVNSGARQIFVLTQYKSESLHQHVQEGWGISSAGLGDFIYCIPAQQRLGADWYRGTADSVRQNLHLLRDRAVDQILVLSGDHVYKMNYRQMINYHRAKKSGLTISAIRVLKEQAANRLGVLEVDHDNKLISFEEKPAQPRTIPGSPGYAFASMGVYVFQADALQKALQGTEEDFGREVIPRMKDSGYDIFVYDYEKENRIEDFIIEVRDGKRTKVLTQRTRDSSYWKDVGTIDSYYEASMDLVGVDPLFNLYGEKWPLRTHHRSLPPSKCIIGGTTPESMVSDGCIISGGVVWNSILSPGVVVERGAVVEKSIVFEDVIIEPYAKVRGAIIDKEVTVRSGVSIGYNPEADEYRGCTVTDSGIVVIPKGADIG